MEARRLSLFDDDPVTKLAGLLPALSAAMHCAANESRMSREQIVDKMNETAKRAGVGLNSNARTLSVAVLEKWLNPSETGHRPSLAAVHVFCLVLDDVRPLEVLLGLHDCGLMTREDRKLRDYGAAILAERDARKRKKQLEAKLG
jgi:hypothetical protein